jgi:hypothetical protein
MNPVHILALYFSKIHFNIMPPIYTLVCQSVSSLHVLVSACLVLLDFIAPRTVTRACKSLLGKLNGANLLEDVGEDAKIILKLILHKWGTGYVRLRTESSGGLL